MWKLVTQEVVVEANLKTWRCDAQRRFKQMYAGLFSTAVVELYLIETPRRVKWDKDPFENTTDKTAIKLKSSRRTIGALSERDFPLGIVSRFQWAITHQQATQIEYDKIKLHNQAFTSIMGSHLNPITCFFRVSLHFHPNILQCWIMLPFLMPQTQIHCSVQLKSSTSIYFTTNTHQHLRGLNSKDQHTPRCSHILHIKPCSLSATHSSAHNSRLPVFVGAPSYPVCLCVECGPLWKYVNPV